MSGPHFKRVLPLLILVVVGMTLLGNTRSAFWQEAVNAQIANTAPSISSGNNQFAFDLFKNVASAQGDANVFLSPVSISTALAMTYAGSEGETRKQMAQVLHFAGSQQDVASRFHSLMASMSQPTDAAYQLQVANALWAQEGQHFQPQFASLMHTYYSGDFNTLDFAKTQESLATINHWVAEKTADKITQLLHADDIKAPTLLVLTNAVYFKGSWTIPFTESLTKPETFTTGDGTKKQVPMMHQKPFFRYAQVGDLQALELPYKGNDLSMLVLLPQAESLNVWAEFTWEKVQQLRSQMKTTEVDVSFPKFKVEARLSLARTLSGMGMPDAFDRYRADLSGMTGKKDCFISAVVHEAVIDVNEKGTEAAGATGVVVKPGVVLAEEPVVFRADHPFLYMIIHKPSDSILFMGRLSNPPQ